MRVLLFASAREAVEGRSELRVELPSQGESLAQLLAELERAHPRLRRVLGRSRVSVNGEYVHAPFSALRLHGSDEVAILPPYSGG